MFGSGLGTFLTTGIVFRFTSNLDPKLSFAIIAIINAAFGIYVLFAVKEPKDT
jgi:hypothetical protein